jgi:cytochrome oxidase Cu insertion factor (SCO1/SenC/PrrC family)
MQFRYLLALFVILSLLVAACGAPSAPAAPSTSSEAAPTEEMADEEMADEEMMDEATAEPTEEMMEEESSARPAWQQLPLTNAQTGESFTLADFAGKTVYVEPFATWCTNCRQQLNNVKAAQGNFGDEVVFVVLSVEPNIGNEALAQYAVEHGFEMIFAAMSPDMLRETVAVFGQTISNPPATPHFVIRPDGTTTELLTGIEGPEAITSLIQAEQS